MCRAERSREIGDSSQRSGCLSRVAGRLAHKGGGPTQTVRVRLPPAAYPTTMEWHDGPGIAHPHPPTRGLFLTLDSPDGGGKTTQARPDWPSGSPFAGPRRRHLPRPRRDRGAGERLRHILQDRATVNLGRPRLRCSFSWPAGAHARRGGPPPTPCRRGRVVSVAFCWRTSSTRGFAGGLSIEEIGQVGRAATGGLFPDLTLILDIAPAVARARVGAARDRIEDRPDAYHARVRDGFLRAARDEARPYYPAPIVVIDAATDPDAVFLRIRSEVERALALGPRP